MEFKDFLQILLFVAVIAAEVIVDWQLPLLIVIIILMVVFVAGWQAIEYTFGD